MGRLIRGAGFGGAHGCFVGSKAPTRSTLGRPGRGGVSTVPRSCRSAGSEAGCAGRVGRRGARPAGAGAGGRGPPALARTARTPPPRRHLPGLAGTVFLHHLQPPSGDPAIVSGHFAPVLVVWLVTRSDKSPPWPPNQDHQCGERLPVVGAGGSVVQVDVAHRYRFPHPIDGSTRFPFRSWHVAS